MSRFLVWIGGGPVPVVTRFDSLDEATEEAERLLLLAKNRNKDIHVLELKATVRAEWRRHWTTHD